MRVEYRIEPFQAGCVPYLQIDLLLFQLDHFEFEINTWMQSQLWVHKCGLTNTVYEFRNIWLITQNKLKNSAEL